MVYLIKNYSLNALKSLLNNEYQELNQKEEIISLLYFIKIDLPILIKNKINSDTTKKELLELLNVNKIPKSLFYFLKYSDYDSFIRFKNAIIKESLEEYYDE